MRNLVKSLYLKSIFFLFAIGAVIGAFTISITGSPYRAYLPHELAVAFVDFGESTGLTETILGLIRTYSAEEDRETDNPMGWAQYRRMQQSDEKGQVSADGWVRALQFRSFNVENTERTRTRPMGLKAPIAGISQSGWTALGPGNIGGRIRAIIFDPQNASKMWIGTAGGGVWKSSDGGTSWSPAGDFMGSLSVSALATPSGNASVIYAGTGEGFYNVDAIRGAGIFKSTDGGVSWQQLASTNPANNPDWYTVNRISVNPSNPNIILAAVGGLCGGDVSAHLSGCGMRNGGVYRSTDAGATWSLVRASSYRQKYSIGTDVKFNPSDGTKAVASFSNFESVAAYYSTDSGATWTASDLPGYRKEFAWGTNNTVYASTCVSNYDNGGALYVSTNGGANWTLKSYPGHLPRQCWYDNAIWVDPTNNNHIVVAGVDIFRSLDGGSTWSQISQWQSPGSVHSDHHAIASPPNYSATSTVYFGNDGGLYKTNISLQTGNSYTSNWIKLNNGLAITQFMGGDGHNGTNGHIYGGAQDNGSLVYSGTGTNWTDIYGGDGGFTQVDPTDGNYMYGEYVYLYVHRKTATTSSARDIYSGISDAGNGNNALFYAPIRLDPNNPNTLYAGGASLWRSQNVKTSVPTWSAVSSSSNLISQIAVAKGNSDIVWFGDTGGRLYYSSNATAAQPTFTVKGTGTLPARSVLSLLIDKTTNTTVYAGFSGFTSGNLWKTTNSGASWTNISGNLPQSGILAIERHPTNANYLYVGTEVGLFASTDGGATWSTSNDGPANTPVMGLFWLDSSTLIASTHGRGMFKATLSTSTTNYNLSYTKAGAGSGTVAFSSGSNASCSSTCTNTYTSGTSVTLTATASTGASFAGWSGACSGTSTTCVVTMSSAQSVTATFNTAPSFTLTYTKAGTGSGSVAFSSGSTASCSSTCTNTYTSGTSVTLTASAATGAAFSGWSGACSGTSSTCVVTMSKAQNVTAIFTSLPTYTLSYTKSGTGSGSVAFSSGSNASCSSTCTNTYTSGTSVTLTASAATGAAFSGWSGACSGTSSTCVMTMSKAQNVTAIFTSLPTYTLSYTKSGTGSGTVAFSSGYNSNCSASCTNTYTSGTSVTLTATANSDSTFAGWSGACSGSSSTCVVTISAATAVTAIFNTLPTYTLAYTNAGTGSGTIAFSSGSNTSCTTSCSNSYVSGTSVTLTATANSDSTFVGWGGACSGSSSTCVVTMSAATSVTATFNLAQSNSYFGSANHLYCNYGSYATGFYFTTVIDGTAKSAFSTYYTSYATVTSGQKTVSLYITNISCMPSFYGVLNYTLAPNYYYMFDLDGYSNYSWHITIYSSLTPDNIRQNKTEITVPFRSYETKNGTPDLGVLSKTQPNQILQAPPRLMP